MKRQVRGRQASGKGWSAWEAYCAVKDNNISLLKKGNEENKLDPNASFRGGTILSTAILSNHVELVEILLQMGADPNLKSEQNGRREPPLITAIRLKNTKLVPVLIAGGAKLEATNFYGQDAVYQTIVTNTFGTLDLLLSKIVPLTSGALPHPVLTACPLYLALTESILYSSRRRSLYLLLRSHYHESCLKALLLNREESGEEDGKSDHQVCHNNSVWNQSNSCFLGQSVIRRIDRDVFLWIYLSHGIRFYPPLTPPPSPTQRNAVYLSGALYDGVQGEIVWGESLLSPSQSSPSSATGFCPSRPSFSSSSPTRRDHLADCPIKLSYLTRIIIRKIAYQIAQRNKINFIKVVQTLPLPLGLIKFLLLSDVRVS